MTLPLLLSLTEVAALTDMPRHRVEHMAEMGGLPVWQPTGSRGKRFVVLEGLRKAMPDLYEAIVRKGEIVDDHDDVY